MKVIKELAMILLTTLNGPVATRIVNMLKDSTVVVAGLLSPTDNTPPQADLKNISLREGNLNEVKTLQRALVDIDTVCLLSNNSKNMCQQELNMIQACQKAGIKKIVKLSGLSPQIKTQSTSGLYRDHFKIETALKASGIPYTILQPSIITQNLVGEVIAPMLQTSNTFMLPFKDQKANLIDATDIALACINCLLKDRHYNQTFVLTGFDTLNMSQLASLIGRYTQREINYQNESMNATLKRLDSVGLSSSSQTTIKEEYQCIARGDAAFYTDAVLTLTGRPPLPVDEYIENNLDLFTTPGMKKKAA